MTAVAPEAVDLDALDFQPMCGFGTDDAAPSFPPCPNPADWVVFVHHPLPCGCEQRDMQLCDGHLNLFRRVLLVTCDRGHPMKFADVVERIEPIR